MQLPRLSFGSLPSLAMEVDPGNVIFGTSSTKGHTSSSVLAWMQFSHVPNDFEEDNNNNNQTKNTYAGLERSELFGSNDFVPSALPFSCNDNPACGPVRTSRQPVYSESIIPLKLD